MLDLLEVGPGDCLRCLAAQRKDCLVDRGNESVGRRRHVLVDAVLLDQLLADRCCGLAVVEGTAAPAAPAATTGKKRPREEAAPAAASVDLNVDQCLAFVDLTPPRVDTISSPYLSVRPPRVWAAVHIQILHMSHPQMA